MLIKSKEKKYLLYIFLVLNIISVVGYCYVRIVSKFLNKIPTGDEDSFLPIFKLFVGSGFSESNIFGNSTIFNLLAYGVHQIGFNELLSLRIVSLIFSVLSILVLWGFLIEFYKYLPKMYKIAILMTSINVLVVMSFLFSGINDSIITFFVLLLFVITYRIKLNPLLNKNYILLGLVFGLMLCTRKMSILFYPIFSIILGVYFYINKLKLRKIIGKTVLIFASFVSVLLIFNFPSILEKKKISFHEKTFDYKEYSWKQFQYLTAIKLEKGEVEYGKHCKREELDHYILENGINSLPNGSVEAIFFNIPRTIRDTSREFIFLFKPYTRLLGLIFIISIYILLEKIFRRKLSVKKIFLNEIFFFILSYSFILSLIVSSYVESRWLMSAYVIAPVLLFSSFFNYYKGKRNETNIMVLVFSLHFLSLTVMNLKFLINNYKIIF